MTVFEKIIEGTIPAYKVLEDSDYLAFLDINPVKRGHTLVIPKKPVDYIFDLENDTLSGLMVFDKKVGKAIEKAVACERIGLAVVGLEVPHTHIHLIPIDSVADLSFSNPKVNMQEDEFQNLLHKIQSFL
jgi:histidine triad (HIT) family protein